MRARLAAGHSATETTSPGAGEVDGVSGGQRFAHARPVATSGGSACALCGGLANGICVPHAPGPSETSAEACREHAETHPCSREREVVGGPLDTIVALVRGGRAGRAGIVLHRCTAFVLRRAPSCCMVQTVLSP